MTRRSAFTLIELLVVSGILATLFALMVVGGRGTTASQVRLAAQGLATALVQSQSRALGADVGTGIVIEAVAGNMGGLIVDANPRSALRGSGAISIQSSTTALLQSQLYVFNDDVTALQDGYQIQFRQDGLVRSSRPSVFFQLKQGANVSLRADAGQTANNTIWPDTVAGPSEFLVPRYPSRGSVRFTLPSQAAVDLRFSGLGDDPYSNQFGTFKSAETIAVCFDTVGHLESLMRDVYSSSTSPGQIEPNANVYFLIALRESISVRQVLASDKALWVVVKPSTGRVSVAVNVPQTIDESFLDALPNAPANRQQLRTALWNARGKARAGANIK